MIRISLTTWFAIDETSFVPCAKGIVGHLTEEQYEQAKGWLNQMAQWTDENREKDGEQDDKTGCD